MQTILITGSSGFIGFHTSRKLLEAGHRIIGIDNENDYYDVGLKQARRKILEWYENFVFYPGTLADLPFVEKVFAEAQPEKVLNLAAQPGVRYSLINPFAYIQSNIVGFTNLIEVAKRNNVKNFVYASSSSVYGNNEKQPFSVEDRVDNPISLYAATKKSDELIAHAYSHLFGLPTIGLRFFTVYGPYGRPDMSPIIFAGKISRWETLDVFNYGKSKRDFTYVDDIVDWILLCLEANFRYEIFNLGNDRPVELEHMISIMEACLGKKAIKNYLPIQPGDVPDTWSDIEHTKKMLWWEPKTKIEEWLTAFVDWYKEYYK